MIQRSETREARSSSSDRAPLVRVGAWGYFAGSADFFTGVFSDSSQTEMVLSSSGVPRNLPVLWSFSSSFSSFMRYLESHAAFFLAPTPERSGYFFSGVVAASALASPPASASVDFFL